MDGAIGADQTDGIGAGDWRDGWGQEGAGKVKPSNEAWTLLCKMLPYAVMQQNKIKAAIQSGMNPNNLLYAAPAEFTVKGGRATPKKA